MQRKPGLPFQRLEVEQALPPPETLVGFLDGDDVGTHLGDDGRYPRRLETPVRADAFVDVVGRDDDLWSPLGIDGFARRAFRNLGRLQRLDAVSAAAPSSTRTAATSS